MIGQAFSLFFGLCGFFFFFYVFLSLMKLFTWKAIACSNPSIFLLLFSLFFLPCSLFLFLSSSLFSYSFAFLDGPPDWKSNVRWLLWFALLVTAVHFLLYASFITTESMLYYCKTIIPPACVHMLLLLMIINIFLSLSVGAVLPY